MTTDKIIPMNNCFKKIFFNEIEDFIKENLNDDWIQLILDNHNQALQATAVEKKKTLFETHRSLLIRWAVQLNKDSRDSYSSFRSLKQSNENKTIIKSLKLMCNCLFSEEAYNKILNKQHVGVIHYEHNPSVKSINDKINNTKKLLDKQYIKSAFIQEKYCVIIISSNEYRRMNQKNKTEGSFKDRLQEAEINKLYKIDSKVIQGL